jgi:hypothetical protein
MLGGQHSDAAYQKEGGREQCELLLSCEVSSPLQLLTAGAQKELRPQGPIPDWRLGLRWASRCNTGRLTSSPARLSRLRRCQNVTCTVHRQPCFALPPNMNGVTHRAFGPCRFVWQARKADRVGLNTGRNGATGLWARNHHYAHVSLLPGGQSQTIGSLGAGDCNKVSVQRSEASGL